MTATIEKTVDDEQPATQPVKASFSYIYPQTILTPPKLMKFKLSMN